jgi:hypothetical protein
MDIDLADVTQTLDEEGLQKLEQRFRQREGGRVSPYQPGQILLDPAEYNPKKTHSRDLLAILWYLNLHGELVGL